MSVRLRRDGVSLAAFAGLAALVAWRYAGVEVHPPVARAGAFVVLAFVAAGTMIAIRGRGQTAARACALVVLLAMAVNTSGVPTRLLAPWRWDALISRVGGGLGAVDSILWPYSGPDRWTRIDLRLVLGTALVFAAALAFWPADGQSPTGARVRPRALARARLRRLVALGLLLTVYVLGLLDSNGGSLVVEGLLLLGLIAAWLWPPEVGRRRTGAAIAWLAAAGAFAAVLAAQLSGSQPWLAYRSWDLLGSADSGIAFSWDQTYGPLRWNRSERTVFTVSSPRPELWKTTTLDRFDGRRFTRSATPPPGDGDLPLPLNDTWYRFVRFTIGALKSNLVPAEQGVTAGVDMRLPLDYKPDGTVTTRGAALPTGTTYTVMSYVPEPTKADLRSAPGAIPADYRRYTEFELPGRGGPGPTVTSRARRLILASPYAPMYRLAHRLAVGRHNRYDVALAIERYLDNNAAYDEQVPARRYPLEAFVFADRIGYCQQFSGAMALMLRMDAIPARIAAGFLPGAYDAATREWVVRAVDAHSWVEVFFGGIGWVSFDPTPPRVQGTPQRPLFTSPAAARVTELQALAATVGSPRPAVIVSRGRRGGGGIDATGWMAGAATGLAALLALAVRWTAGSVRLRRSLGTDGELAARELVRGLRRLGYAIPATATLARIEAVVGLHGGPEAARYVRHLRGRRYGPGHPAAATLRDRRRLRRGLTRRRGFGVVLRGLWALPPGTVGWRIRLDQPGGQ